MVPASVSTATAVARGAAGFIVMIADAEMIRSPAIPFPHSPGRAEGLDAHSDCDCHFQ